MNGLVKGIIGATLLTVASAASAGPVNINISEVTGTFTATAYRNVNGFFYQDSVEGNGSSTLNWGIDNILKFDAAGDSIVSLGSSFNFGRLTHRNGIAFGSELYEAKLDLSFVFNNPNGDATSSGYLNFSILDTSGWFTSDKIIQDGNNVISSAVRLGDYEYTLELIGLGDGEEISTPEFFSSRKFLTAKISATDVPEPGTLALLGLGLVGVAAARRRTAR